MAMSNCPATWVRRPEVNDAPPVTSSAEPWPMKRARTTRAPWPVSATRTGPSLWSQVVSWPSVMRSTSTWPTRESGAARLPSLKSMRPVSPPRTGGAPRVARGTTHDMGRSLNTTCPRAGRSGATPSNMSKATCFWKPLPHSMTPRGGRGGLPAGGASPRQVATASALRASMHGSSLLGGSVSAACTHGSSRWLVRKTKRASSSERSPNDAPTRSTSSASSGTQGDPRSVPTKLTSPLTSTPGSRTSSKSRAMSSSPNTVMASAPP
jgi:hypothetical protein